MPQPSRKTARPASERSTRRAAAASRPAKGTQRERLIDAFVELVGWHSYAGVSIAQISSRAGVSSATFYEHFADKEECLVEAYRTVSGRALGRMRAELARPGDWSQAARRAFTELLASLQEDPHGARLMFVEAMTGGERMQDELATVIAGLEQTGDALLDGVPASGTTLDIPARALMGAVRAVVSRYLRTYSDDRLPELTDDLLAWMGSYAVLAGGVRWSTSARALGGVAAADPASSVGLPPELERLPRGRHGLPDSVVARSQRTRIVYATATVTMEKGYSATTVADIVTSAGVAKEAFYRHFRDKEEAFLEAQQYGTHFVLDALVAAHFSVEGWPRRIWKSLGAMLDLVAGNPLLAHLRLVESYGAGGTAIRRADDIPRFFGMFLEEGYYQGEARRELPRLSSHAISGAILELVQRDVAAGEGANLPRRRPQLAYIALAPFLGPAQAIAAIEEMAAADSP